MNEIDKILVSTITPCFRMKRYLKDFLEWLPQQTMFEQMEIVLDHNEPDEEELLWVRDFQERHPNRIKHIVVNKVDPIGVSMNRCIQQASGEYLAIWNVDDLRTPESIDSQLQLLSNNSDIDIVYGNYCTVNSFGTTDGEVINHKSIPEANQKVFISPYLFTIQKSSGNRLDEVEMEIKE